jgi:hypothetical protein
MFFARLYISQDENGPFLVKYELYFEEVRILEYGEI